MYLAGTCVLNNTSNAYKAACLADDLEPAQLGSNKAGTGSHCQDSTGTQLPQDNTHHVSAKTGCRPFEPVQ